MKLLNKLNKTLFGTVLCKKFRLNVFDILSRYFKILIDDDSLTQLAFTTFIRELKIKPWSLRWWFRFTNRRKNTGERSVKSILGWLHLLYYSWLFKNLFISIKFYNLKKKYLFATNFDFSVHSITMLYVRSLFLLMYLSML